MPKSEVTSILSRDDLLTKLMTYMDENFNRPEGMHLFYDIVDEDKNMMTFIAGFFNFDEQGALDMKNCERNLIRLSRINGDIISTVLVSIDEDEMKKLVEHANLGTLAKYYTHGVGVYGTTYKVIVGSPQKQDVTETYIVQLRYHGDVYSMNSLIQQLHSPALKDLPVPENLFISNDSKSGLGIQVSQFIPGPMGFEIYNSLSFEHKIFVVKQVARAFAAMWDFQTAKKTLIGEEYVTSKNNTKNFGVLTYYKPPNGPFKSVAAYLQAWIKHRYEQLSENGPKEFKEKYAGQIGQFVQNELENIPSEVEEVPISVVNADMSLHNMIFSEPSSESEPKLLAVIDWELVYYIPFLINIPTKIDPMFASGDDDNTLKNYFWDEIPKWKEILAKSSCQTFLEYYNFGISLKPEDVFNVRGKVEIKWEIWKQNTEVVESFLRKNTTTSKCTM